jgi:putative sigma-54 modulation protein
MKAYAARKIAALERYLPRLREVTVEFGYEDTRAARQRIVVQITANDNGTLLRAEERGADLRSTIDLASDVIRRQARRHKERRFRNRNAARQASAPAEAAEDELLDEAESVLGKIVRVKRFPVKPMTEEEAVEQMELLGHNFFLFLDADANSFALLYRRRDGQYGLIIPETS